MKPIREALARWLPDTELLELGYVDGTEILPLRQRRNVEREHGEVGGGSAPSRDR